MNDRLKPADVLDAARTAADLVEGEATNDLTITDRGLARNPRGDLLVHAFVDLVRAAHAADPAVPLTTFLRAYRAAADRTQPEGECMAAFERDLHDDERQ